MNNGKGGKRRRDMEEDRDVYFCWATVGIQRSLGAKRMGTEAGFDHLLFLIPN